ncbi:MAG: hypothetical protein KME30_10540 [Iphinoe sp. HA4291-MV1]|nr:hypothetical protein [Iphinoe sp. HA4291-MV1]
MKKTLLSREKLTGNRRVVDKAAAATFLNTTAVKGKTARNRGTQERERATKGLATKTEKSCYCSTVATVEWYQ